MKKMRVISLYHGSKKNAGPKAQSDVDKILAKHFDAKTVSYNRDKSKLNKLKPILEFLKSRFSTDVVVIQYPMLLIPLLYSILPKKRTIIVIHDLPNLRIQQYEKLKKEVQILKKFKYIIVHNDKMKKFLVDSGIKKEALYELEIFDYLCDENAKKNSSRAKNLEVVYTGNLSKSPFLVGLDSERMNYKIKAYGIGKFAWNNKKIEYCGVFEPDEVPLRIIGDLGLVWDGAVDESDKDETYKNYTKLNNPHKTSCYLAAGMPIVVWEKAAIADFVKKNKIGYTISNLYDINNLNLKEYNEIKGNAERIGEKVREGFYLQKVVNVILNDMRHKGE